MWSPFDPKFEDLPRVIPVFPLHGCLLLPNGQLPLNIFEPRYLAMTRDALGGDRMVGMIQPTGPEDRFGQPELYRTGCAGRVISFSETQDGRYLITLNGLCRFDVAEELPLVNGYRRVVASFAAYRADMAPVHNVDIDRARLLQALRGYFEHRQLAVNWEAIERAPDEQLVVSLAMMCPFKPNEKQALLEAADVGVRAQTMMALLEMAQLDPGGDPGQPSH